MIFFGWYPKENPNNGAAAPLLGANVFAAISKA
jgi:hypothetical protein